MFAPVLATSGIDYDVKLWSPCSPEADFDDVKAEEVSDKPTGVHSLLLQ